MQLMLIFGIVFAIGAVAFALQNNVIVTVTMAVWTFEGSLALVLLVALGLGVLITGLLSSPTVIRRQWTTVRLRHQVTVLEEEVSKQQIRIKELATELTRLTHASGAAESVAEKPYVGLRALFSSESKVSSSLAPQVKGEDKIS